MNRANSRALERAKTILMGQRPPWCHIHSKGTCTDTGTLQGVGLIKPQVSCECGFQKHIPCDNNSEMSFQIHQSDHPKNHISFMDDRDTKKG
jgi:hypothetical protein